MNNSSTRRKMLKRALILSYLLLTGCSSKDDKNINNYASVSVPVIEQEEIIETKEIEVKEPEEVIETPIVEEEPVKDNEHVDLLMIGDMLIHTPVYKSGIQDDGSLNYDHFFEHIQEDLDEAASAYKNIDIVMEEQKDLVDILVKLNPLAVIKG